MRISAKFCQTVRNFVPVLTESIQNMFWLLQVKAAILKKQHHLGEQDQTYMRHGVGIELN
jgi:hypothetical protein